MKPTYEQLEWAVEQLLNGVSKADIRKKALKQAYADQLDSIIDAVLRARYNYFPGGFQQKPSAWNPPLENEETTIP